MVKVQRTKFCQAEFLPGQRKELNMLNKLGKIKIKKKMLLDNVSKNFRTFSKEIKSIRTDNAKINALLEI